MDWAALIPGLVESLPQGTVIGAVLLWVLIREKAVAGDRTHWQKERDAWSAETAKVREARDQEFERLGKVVEKLRTDNDGLEAKLDGERTRRRAAEDGTPTVRHRRIDPDGRAS